MMHCEDNHLTSVTVARLALIKTPSFSSSLFLSLFLIPIYTPVSLHARPWLEHSTQIKPRILPRCVILYIGPCDSGQGFRLLWVGSDRETVRIQDYFLSRRLPSHFAYNILYGILRVLLCCITSRFAVKAVEHAQVSASPTPLNWFPGSKRKH